VKHNDKALNLVQLANELAASGINVSALGTDPTDVFTYDASGEMVDLPGAAQPVLDAHAPMRDKNDAEYTAEFHDARTRAPRRQQIRDILAGLEVREQVPM
jgi:hypothetical protein